MSVFGETKTVGKLTTRIFQRVLSHQERTQREQAMIPNGSCDGSGKTPKHHKFLMVRWPHGTLTGLATDTTMAPPVRSVAPPAPGGRRSHQEKL